ncbi:MAG: sigma 54-interacting transcriptional regulator [Sinobacteraceae bacterium]|nr:sigma 54-interacting transcriptional regulator [Nevskiaceae bacterium]
MAASVPKQKAAFTGSSQRADTQALLQQLNFSPDTGLVHLFDERMLLMHAEPLAELRRELVSRLGTETARELLCRMGYQQGFADGLHVKEMNLGPLARQLEMGPRLREIEGFVRNLPIDRMRVDADSGAFHGDFYWAASWEAQAHLSQFGISGAPACWVMIGYAGGYTTAITGMPVHWRESECKAMGHARCRVVGRPLAEWEDLSATEIAYLRSTPFAGELARTQTAPGGRGSRKRSRRTTSPDPRPTETIRPAEAMAVPGFEELIGTSAGFNATADLVRRVAPMQSSVLLYGESGVGKEGFARALHRLSKNAGGPLVTVNCAAIPHDLIEAELFGVERGAFTGADRSRPGRFERADGGTLFLDEVASLSLAAQGKLLRALQEGEVERVGGTEVRHVNVRLVAAANRSLREEVAAERFREDLFFRLNVFPITIPPLRERRTDIPLLASVFLQQYQAQCDKTIRGLTPRASAALLAHAWPGNVRELQNKIERGVILAEAGGIIDVQHLFTQEDTPNPNAYRVSDTGQVVPAAAPESAPANTDSQELVAALLAQVPQFRDMERMVLEQALEKCHGNVAATARLLGLSRPQVEYRLKQRLHREN